MTDIFDGQTIRELCEIIAPQTGPTSGPGARDTHIPGTAKILADKDITAKMLYNYISGENPITHPVAEALLEAAFPNDPPKQDSYRIRPGYPIPSMDFTLQKIGQSLSLPEPLPSCKEFFDAALRLQEKTQKEITGMTNAQEILSGRSSCNTQQATSLLAAIGFSNGLDVHFIQQAYAEITLFGKRREKFGSALYAALHCPEAIDSSLDNITNVALASAIGVSPPAISNYLNGTTQQGGRVPSVGVVHDIVAALEERLRGIIERAPVEIPKINERWNEAYFYTLAGALRQKYADCIQPEKTPPAAAVIEWSKCLNALLSVLPLTERELGSSVDIDQGTINNYRHAETARGPGRNKAAIEKALGCENAEDFLEKGKAAQHVLALRQREDLPQLIRAFRESKGLTREVFSKQFGIPDSTQSNLETGTKGVGNPEVYSQRIGFAPDVHSLRFTAAHPEQPAAAEALKRERLPAEFYFYNQMGLEPNAAHFRSIMELRDTLRPKYESLQKTAAAETTGTLKGSSAGLPPEPPEKGRKT